ncbi:MAG: alpha/beta hydrolase [Acetilactobacillus jinshanensis]
MFKGNLIMKKNLKRFSLIIFILAVLLGAGLVSAGFYFYNVSVVPSHKGFINNHQADEMNGQQWFKQVHAQKWRQTSATRDLKLDANYVPAERPTRKTIVIAHGYMGDKNTMWSYAKLFHNLGYNVLVPDDRGQGQSQGHYIGYGWPDRLDYIKWINKVIRHNGQQSKIVMFGVSMGGATTMMVSGQSNVPPQVKGYIEDCGYDSVNSELHYEAGQLYHMPSILQNSLIPIVSQITQLKDGYNFVQASALNQVKKNHRPMLFIHGGNDQFVPTRMVYKLYRADRGPKQLLVVKGAPHASSYHTDPQLYRRTIVNFLKQYFK